MAQTDGLPDVDLGSIMKDLEDKDKDQKDTKKDVQEKVATDLGQFKNPEELLKAYKEIQGFATRTSQEKKELEKRISELTERIELSKNAGQQFTQNVSDDSFYENPQQTIEQTILTARIAEIIEDEQDKEDFQERYTFAQRVIGQYPHLANTPGGVKKAFKYGDKLRKEYLKTATSKSLESWLGEPVTEEHLERFRNLIKGETPKQTNNNSNAYMPDTNTSTTKSQNQDQNTGFDSKISEAVQKGDVDGVLDNLLQKQLAE